MATRFNPRRAFALADQVEVTNVAVRTQDREAFLATINVREDHLVARRKKLRFQSAQAAEVASFGLAATEVLTGADANRELAIAHLESAAALAIGLLADLKGKRR